MSAPIRKLNRRRKAKHQKRFIDWAAMTPQQKAFRKPATRKRPLLEADIMAVYDIVKLWK